MFFISFYGLQHEIQHNSVEHYIVSTILRMVYAVKIWLHVRIGVCDPYPSLRLNPISFYWLQHWSDGCGENIQQIDANETRKTHFRGKSEILINKQQHWIETNYIDWKFMLWEFEVKHTGPNGEEWFSLHNDAMVPRGFLASTLATQRTNIVSYLHSSGFYRIFRHFYRYPIKDQPQANCGGTIERINVPCHCGDTLVHRTHTHTLTTTTTFPATENAPAS